MKILLLGSNGQLGKELERQLHVVGNLVAFPRSELDIKNHVLVSEAIRCVQPNIIVNAAAFTAVDKAEKDAEYAYAVNADAVANLAKIAQKERAWLIHYSTDYVFDGSKTTPYLETDAPNPINVYGASKLAGEEAILEANCQHLIFRTTWVIGKDGNNFAKTILRLAAVQDSLKVINDQLGVPTSPGLISKVTIDAIMAIKNGDAWQSGVYHLAPRGVSNWCEIAQTLLTFTKCQNIMLRAKDIEPIKTSEYSAVAMRPMNSQLDTHKLLAQLSFALPHWKEDFMAVASDLVKELQAA